MTCGELRLPRLAEAAALGTGRALTGLRRAGRAGRRVFGSDPVQDTGDETTERRRRAGVVREARIGLAGLRVTGLRLMAEHLIRLLSLTVKKIYRN
jgi:hypothetical protein